MTSVQGHRLPLQQELWPYQSFFRASCICYRRPLWPVFFHSSAHSGTSLVSCETHGLCCMQLRFFLFHCHIVFHCVQLPPFMFLFSCFECYKICLLMSICVLFVLFYYTLSFIAALESQWNWAEGIENSQIPPVYTPPPPPCNMHLSIINIFDWGCQFVSIDEPILTHHPKSIA